MQQAPASPPTSPFNVADLRNAYHEDAQRRRHPVTAELPMYTHHIQDVAGSSPASRSFMAPCCTEVVW